MSKILFTHSYFYRLDAKQWKFKQPYPPLATLIAAAVARENNFDTYLFDVGLCDGPIEIRAILEKERPNYFVIYDDGFNYLTKMCLTVMREAAFKMSELAKEMGCTVIISSSDSTDHYEKYFLHGVDYVIRGEGEETLKELLVALKEGSEKENIKGLAFRKDSITSVTSPREVMRHLDSLPMPAWDLIDLEPYRKIWLKHHGYFSLNMATTRGCPYKCNWCAKPIYGNRYNSRSPKKVVDEIEYLLKNYKPDHFWMCDDIFGLKPGWIQEFSNEIKSRNLKFNYKIQSRVDLLLKEDTVEALAQSGAETVWVGAESGSQKILDAMDKGTTIEQIYRATRLLTSHGIRAAFFLQFGYPGEEKSDIDKTLNMVLDLMPEEIGISVSYPLPGTQFYENVKAQMGIKQNWVDSDEMAMMFEGTFNSNYYKQLPSYIHSVYRKHKGYRSLIKAIRKPFQLNYKDVQSAMAIAYYIPSSLVKAWKLRKIQNT